MFTIDPIIAVKDVEKSSHWYQSVFGWRSKHGGNKFDILVTQEDQVVLCLHRWGEHEHPTMQNPEIIPGNGMILYIRTDSMEELRNHLLRSDIRIEKDIHLNPNSHRKEFSLRDPDGYYLTISEYHEYEG